VITCPNCGFENREEEKLCVRCGQPLVDLTKETATRTLGDTDYEEGVPKWGSARFNAQMYLILEAVEYGQSYTFDANQVDQLIIGRKDPNTGTLPDVDLSIIGAVEHGVSRQHAMVIRQDGALHIMDNNSANGTYLNGQRLVAQQPRVLRDGDDVRLGHLIMRVTFQQGQPG